MGLAEVITINISRLTAAVTQAGFGTPLIMGLNASFANNAPRAYSDLPSVLSDGFTTSMDEYKAARACFAQSPRPASVKIGKLLAAVAQVTTWTPDISTQAIEHFIVTIDGVAYDFTSDASPTAAEVVTGLKALINGDTNAKVTATGTATLIATANEAGVPFSYVDGLRMVSVATTANVGMPESLAALSAVDDDWYALVSTVRTKGFVLATAAYIEANVKIFGVSSNDAGLLDPTSVTDKGYLLKAANYFRTFMMYSGDTADYPEAALLGRVLPLTPGSEIWSYKQLAGITVDVLSLANKTALAAKNVNFFSPLGGLNVTRGGKVAAGEWIDVIRLIDLIQARMQEEIFGSQVQNNKIPFTNGGIAIYENDVRGVLRANQKTGGIAPDSVDSMGNIVYGFTTNFPNVNDVSSNDKANRTLTVPNAFTAKLAGAIVFGTLNGNVTV